MALSSSPLNAPASSMPLGHRISPVRGLSAVPEPRPSRVSSPANPRPVLGPVPVARDVEGKALPRAYNARRRSSPRGMPAISLPVPGESTPAPVTSSEHADAAHQYAAGEPSSRPQVAPATAPELPTSVPASTQPSSSVRAESPQPAAPIGSLLSSPLTVRHAVLVLIAILTFALSISTVVAVVVGRTLRQAPASAPAQQR